MVINSGLIDFCSAFSDIFFWVMVFYYLLSPSNAYDINIKIEEHAYKTYENYLAVNPNDQRIREIAQDEINHANELKEAIALIN